MMRIPPLAGLASGLLLGFLALSPGLAQDGASKKKAKKEAIDADLPKERLILKEASSDPRNMKPDAFPVIRKPQYVENLKARSMNPGEWVIGLVLGDKKYAYPINILNHHEILVD
ncbi:MAG: DUF3179 domain-containing (seleno)protein, partial [Planctomycetota bacterium]